MKVKQFPTRVSEFEKSRANFEAWIISRGAQLLERTNPYEVSRFSASDGIALIYRNEAGRITSWRGGAREAFEAFLNGSAWRGTPKGEKIRRSVVEETLIKRDGDRCVYCGASDNLTLEHMLSRTHGGNSHIANLALACDACNKEADHLPVVKKLELAMKKRCASMQGVTP